MHAHGTETSDEIDEEERICPARGGHARDQYASVTQSTQRSLTALTSTIIQPLKTCIEKTYVEAFRYTCQFISLVFLPTYPLSVFTSHQNVVLEIDFAGAIWVRFPSLCDLFPSLIFLRVTRIYLLCQMTRPSEPFISIAASAVRQTIRLLFSPSDASP